MTYVRASLALVLVLLVGCGDRRGAPDAGAPDAGVECAVDTECGDGVACTIDQCVAGACVSEPCEGCCAEPLVCVLERGCAIPPARCEEHADCDDGVRCTLDACDDGLCENQAQSGLCEEEGEMCLADTGCVPARDECESDADCTMGRACDGTWRCDAEFGCQYEGPVDCDDDDACTADACDEAAGGCVHETIDVDMDGDAPLACGGGDCDDDDDAAHDGATESCNEVDDDCDGDVDEEACAPTFDCGSGDAWRATSTVGAPDARYWHTAVWTGREMMIWGGNQDGRGLQTGGLYDPSSDTWRPTSTLGAPSPRFDHVMVWTGSEVLVWGGRDSGDLANGARFDPDTNVWTPMSTVNAPPATTEPQAVWTGTELLVWGDDSVEGGRYDPSTDTWTRTSTTGAPSPRDKFFMVWTGSEAIVWAGRACGGGSCPYVNTGARYATASDRWTPMSTTGAPTGAAWGSAVWTGTEMIVFGGRTCGFTSGCEVDSGGLYAPATDAWRPFATTGRPSARHIHSGVWTGDRMIVWGGASPLTNTGALYDPVADVWTPMTTVGAPSARYLHSGVWADGVFIVWGGDDGPSSVDTGGVYCPPAP